MELNLTRPLLFFDIESTGLNIPVDSIIELSFVKILPGGEQRIKTWKVCPWDYERNSQRPITPGASAVNGVKDEDLTDCPKFYEIADEVIEWLRDADLAGYNSAKFDLPMLAEEIERVRTFKKHNIDLDLHEKKMVDVQNIYHYMEPRNLKAAYRFYCKKDDFENAHTAEADTLATYEVLKGELDAYPDTLKNNVDFLANFAARPKTVDYAARLRFNEDGEAVINFGKYKDRLLRDIAKNDPSYISWVLNGDFCLDTKRQFVILRDKYNAERKAAESRPLEDAEIDDARRQLQDHFTGKLF